MLIMDYGLAFARANVGVPRIAGGITSFSGHSNPPDVISSEIGGLGWVKTVGGASQSTWLIGPCRCSSGRRGNQGSQVSVV